MPKQAAPPEVTQRAGTITLRMTASTAAALSIGLEQLYRTVNLTRRQRFFFQMFATQLRAAISAAYDDGDIDRHMPLAGEGVLFEESEEQLSMPTEPVNFSATWTLRRPEGTLWADEMRHTSKTVWDLVRKAKEAALPLPPGSIDWLRHAGAGDEVRYDTPRYHIVLNLWS